MGSPCDHMNNQSKLDLLSKIDLTLPTGSFTDRE